MCMPIEDKFIKVPKRWRNITEWDYSQDQIKFQDIWEDLCDPLSYKGPDGYVMHGVREPGRHHPLYWPQVQDEAWARAYVEANLEKLEKEAAEHNVFLAKCNLEINGNIDWDSCLAILKREQANQKEIFDYYARR